MKDAYDPAASVTGTIPVMPNDRVVTRHPDGTIEWRIRPGTKRERILTAKPIRRPEFRENYFTQSLPDGTVERVWYPTLASMIRHQESLYLITSNTSAHPWR